MAKLLNGFFVTVAHMAAVKMINESIPVYMLSSYGTIIQTANAFGYLLCLGFGLILPQGDYNPEITDDPLNEKARLANINDEWWRFIGAFPVIVCVWMLLSYLININEDSVMFNLSTGNEKDAMKIIKKIYHKDEDYEMIL